MDPAKPSRNGRATRGSSRDRKDVSSSAPAGQGATGPQRVDHGRVRRVGQDLGSRSAARKAGSAVSARNAREDPLAHRGEQDREEDRRAECAAHLPEERRRRGRHAHVAGRDGVLHRQHEGLHVEPQAEAEDRGRREGGPAARCRRRSWTASPSRPRAAQRPRRGTACSGPVREITCPATTEPTMIPKVSGRSSSPASVGDIPLTICRYSGSAASPPNMPMPRMKFEQRPDAERAPAEEPQRQQGVVAVAALGGDERRDPDDADDHRRHGPQRAPAPVAPLLGEQQHRREPGHQGQRSRPVDAVVAPDVRQVQAAHHEQQRRGADRHVHEEDPAPPGDAEDRALPGQEAADHGTEDARRAEDGEEVALVPRALARRDDVADDRERQREQPARSEALHGPERRQLPHRLGEPAQRRPDHEHRDGRDEEGAPAVEVGELAVERGADRGRHEVRRRGPGLHRQALQVVGDGADRGRDDRLVQRGEEHARHEAGEDREDLTVRQLDPRCGRRRGCGGAHAEAPSVVRASDASSSSSSGRRAAKLSLNRAIRSVRVATSRSSQPATMRANVRTRRSRRAA